MDSSLFMKVWNIRELRELIVSFMYPNEASATWYEYESVDAAVKNGYMPLVKKLSHKLSSDCLVIAALNNQRSIFKYVCARVRAQSVNKVAKAAIRSDSRGMLRLVFKKYRLLASEYFVKYAINNNCLDSLKWLCEYRRRPCDIYCALTAIECSNCEAMVILRHHKLLLGRDPRLVDAAVRAGSATMLLLVWPMDTEEGHVSGLELATFKGDLVMLKLMVAISGKKPSTLLGIAVDCEHINIMEWLVSIGYVCTEELRCQALRRGRYNAVSWIDNNIL